MELSFNFRREKLQSRNAKAEKTDIRSLLFWAQKCIKDIAFCIKGNYDNTVNYFQKVCFLTSLCRHHTVLYLLYLYTFYTYFADSN